MRNKKREKARILKTAGMMLSIVLVASSVPAGTALAADAGQAGTVEQTDAGQASTVEQTDVEAVPGAGESLENPAMAATNESDVKPAGTDSVTLHEAGASENDLIEGGMNSEETVPESDAVSESEKNTSAKDIAPEEEMLESDQPITIEVSAQVAVSTEAELIAAIDDSSTDAAVRTQIVMTQDIAVTQKLVIPMGHYVELFGDKSGRKLSTKNKFSDSQLSPAGVVLVNGDLILHSVEINGSELTRPIAVYDGTLVLNDGAVITGGKILSHMDGGGIYIADDTRTTNQASLTINEGARICDNVYNPAASVEATGIGLYIEQAAVVMNGGEISGNRDISTPSMRSRTASGGAVGISGTTGSFTMNGGTIENNLAKGNGGAFRAENGSKIIINNGTIRNNMCYGDGGAFYLTTSGAGGADLKIKGGVISGNVADATNSAPDTDRSLIGSGGAVFLESGTTMDMSAGTISGNRAIALPVADTNGLDGGQGGAIYAGGTVSISGGIITGNAAVAAKTDGYKTGNGGGIAVSGGATPGTVILSGGTIRENSATLKGADVYVNADKRSGNLMSVGTSLLTTEAQGTLQIKGNPVIGNLFLPSGTEFYVTGAITQAQIRVETEDKENGCVIARGENYRVMAEDARILTNEEGKKVYNLENGAILLTGERSYTDLSTAVIGEITDQVYTGKEITPDPDVVFDGKILTSGTDYQISYSENTDAGEASLRVTGAGMYSGSVEKTFTITPKNLDMISVGSMYDYLYDGEPVLPDLPLSDNDILLEKDRDYSVEFRNNDRIGTAEAVVTGTGNYVGTKVVKYTIISSDGATVCTDEDSLVKAVAAASGTANSPDIIFTSGDIELTKTLDIPADKHIQLIGDDDHAVLTGCVFLANQNEEDNPLVPATEGIIKTSMIRVSGNLMIARLRLQSKPYSKARGAMERVLRVNQGGTLTLNDGCVVSGGYGYVGSGLLNQGTTGIHGAVFSDNRLTSMTNGLGGAIVNDKTGVLTITGGTFSDNLSRKGGAIYNAEGAKAYISGGAFRANTASADQGSSVVLTGEGGAIYNDSDSYVEISGGYFSGNTADDCGGGIANYGTMKITDAVIAENSAGKNGAGLYTAGTAVFDDGTIRDNQIENSTLSFETADGGGVFVARGTFTMNGGSIVNNMVKNTYNSLTSYANAGNGGGVYVSNHKDGSTFIMHGGIISNNEAVSYLKESVMGHGGGVYIAGGSGKATDRECKPGAFLMDGGTVTGNTASGTGDGIYASAECAYNYEENRSEYAGLISGVPSLTIAKSAVVEKNASDNIYLTKGVKVDVTDALTGALALTAEQGADVLVMCGSGYQLTQQDAACITNENGKREVILEPAENTIYLKAVHIESAYRITTAEKIFVYTGENVRPEITVTEKNNAEHVLQEGTEYTVTYTDEAGSEHTSDATDTGGKPYLITVTGCGEYAGTLTKTYTVQPASLSLTEVNLPDQTYTGKAISYLPNLEDIKYLGQPLSRNRDYYIVAGSYRHNTEVGTASFQIIGNRDRNGSGTGNYAGTRTVRFNIIPDTTLTGWGKDDTGWYWVVASGERAKNKWIQSSGEWYYLKADGYMAASEWIKGSKGWCWLRAGGACKRDGWEKISGKWYFFDKDGWMKTGWQKISGKWYYLGSSNDGAMKTGWQKISGKWYYFDGSGAMAAGKWVGNYYLTSDGSMAVSRWIGSYYVGADGKWIPNYK